MLQTNTQLLLLNRAVSSRVKAIQPSQMTGLTTPLGEITLERHFEAPSLAPVLSSVPQIYNGGTVVRIISLSINGGKEATAVDIPTLIVPPISVEEDEAIWDKAFAESRDVLKELARKARTEYRAGLMEDFDPDTDPDFQ